MTLHRGILGRDVRTVARLHYKPEPGFVILELADGRELWISADVEGCLLNRILERRLFCLSSTKPQRWQQ